MECLFKIDNHLLRQLLPDPELKNGVCATAASEFCLNEVNRRNALSGVIACNNYYSELYKFAGRHRAYKSAVAAKMIGAGDFIRPGDGLGIISEFTSQYWNELMLTEPGTYLLIVLFPEGGAHCVALTKRECWIFYDPARGMYKCKEGLIEFIEFMMSNYCMKEIIRFGISKTPRFPVPKAVLNRAAC